MKIKCETIKLLDETENLHELGFADDFENITVIMKTLKSTDI